MPKRPEDIPELEILIVDSPDNSKTISYVNGLSNYRWTEEFILDAVQEPIFKYLCNIINGGTGKEKSLVKNNFSISSKNIRPHLSFIINARVG